MDFRVTTKIARYKLDARETFAAVAAGAPSFGIALKSDEAGAGDACELIFRPREELAVFRKKSGRLGKDG